MSSLGRKKNKRPYPPWSWRYCWPGIVIPLSFIIFAPTIYLASACQDWHEGDSSPSPYSGPEKTAYEMAQKLRLSNISVVCFGNHCTISWSHASGTGGRRVREYWCTDSYCRGKKE